jgi:hypothetical protein
MPEAKWRNPGQTEVGEAGVVAIALIPVVSSQLAAVGYDEGTRELVIRFRTSRRYPEAIYSYDGVPPELARALIVAESPGSRTGATRAELSETMSRAVARRRHAAAR